MLSRDRLRMSFYFIFVVIVTALPAVSSVSPLLPAGTVIHNRVNATFTWQGLTYTSWSHRVDVTVKQIADVRIFPSGDGDPDDVSFVPAHELLATPGQRVVIPFRITNTGNGPDEFVFSMSIQSNNLPNMREVGAYVDVNNDGNINTAHGPVERISLDPGESAALLLSIRMPTNISIDAVYDVGFTARSTFDSAVVSHPMWSRITVAHEMGNLVVTRSVEVNPASVHPGVAGYGSVVVGQGATVSHTISMTNLGSQRAHNVRLTDSLDPNEILNMDTYGSDPPWLLNGLPIGSEPGTGLYGTIAPDGLGNDSIHLFIDSIEPTQTMVFQYEVVVNWVAGVDGFSKMAQVDFNAYRGDDIHVRSNEIVIVKEGTYALSVSSRPESGLSEPGVRSLAYFGENVLFPMEVKNTGNLSGTIAVHVTSFPGDEWKVVFLDSDGVTPLNESFNDAYIYFENVLPQQSKTFFVQITVPRDLLAAGNPMYSFKIVAAFMEGTMVPDSAVLRIDELSTINRLWDPLLLASDRGPGVLPGEPVTFTVSFYNPTPFDVYDVTIELPLTPYLHYVNSVSGAHNRASQSARRNVPVVPAGTGGEVNITTMVSPSAVVGSNFDVAASVTSGSPSHHVRTNSVGHTVVGDALSINASSRLPVVSVGDVNTYTINLTNVSGTGDLHDVYVRVRLPGQLMYRKGSATRNGQKATDPLFESDDAALFSIGHLKQGDTTQIKFDGVVNAFALEDLTVFIQGFVILQPGNVLKSRLVGVRTHVEKGFWSDLGMIAGRVTTMEDCPVGGVRLLLDDGRYVISDRDGYFTLADVEPGARAMTIDRRTLKEINSGHGGANLGTSYLVRTSVASGGISIVNFTVNLNDAKSMTGQCRGAEVSQ